MSNIIASTSENTVDNLYCINKQGRYADMRTPAEQRYRDFLGRFKRLGIPVELTYDEWYNWWLEQGIDKNGYLPRVNKETLILLPKDPTKPITLDNIQVGTYGANDLGLPSSHKNVPKYKIRKNKEEFDHIRYEPYLRARAQWNFRGEENDLTFAEWCELWQPEFWYKRGRKTMRSHGEESYTLTRKDPEKPWTMSNVEITTRTEQIARARQIAKLKREG